MTGAMDLPTKGGFDFDLCRRNNMLEKNGLKVPGFLKTGTTIVGLVFQVELVKGFLAVLRDYLDTLCSNLRSHTTTIVQSNNDKEQVVDIQQQQQQNLQQMCKATTLNDHDNN